MYTLKLKYIAKEKLNKGFSRPGKVFWEYNLQISKKSIYTKSRVLISSLDDTWANKRLIDWLEYGKYENFPDFSLKKNEELKRGRKQNKLMKKHKISTLNYLANNFFLLLVQSHIAITIVTTKMPNIVPTIIQVKLLLLSWYDNALGCFVSPEMKQHTKYIIRVFFATPFLTWVHNTSWNF